MKRLISANASEVLKMNAEELKQSIKASEGRVVLAENVCTRETFIGDITNTEISKSFGADLALLNGFDVFESKVFALECPKDEVVNKLHELAGIPIGLNLEPVDDEVDMLEERLTISKGRTLTVESIKRAEELGFDFVCLTGNPGSGVSNAKIANAIKTTKEHFSGLIIAGKMHGAGSNEPIIDFETVKLFIDSGCDCILVPAVGTVPGFSQEDLTAIVKYAHENDTLVMSAIGTSQEGSDTDIIKNIAIINKTCGVDIQHIGDAGYGGVAPVENIFALSQAIRGIRHTVSRIARSVNR